MVGKGTHALKMALMVSEMETSEALREPPGDRKPAGEVTLGAASDSEVAPAVPSPAPQVSSEPDALPRAPALAMPDDTDEEVLDRRMRRALRTLFELSEQFDDPQIEFQLSGALKDFYGFRWRGPGEVVDATGDHPNPVDVVRWAVSATERMIKTAADPRFETRSREGVSPRLRKLCRR